MLTGFAYAELITKYPHAAGAAMYAGRAFDSRFFTFLVAFCTVAASLAATGALALAFGGYFLELLVALFSLPLLLTALVFVVLLAFINFRGISESVKLNLAMSITELTGLALVLAIGVVVLLTGGADLGRPFEFNGGQPRAPGPDRRHAGVLRDDGFRETRLTWPRRSRTRAGSTRARCSAAWRRRGLST